MIVGLRLPEFPAGALENLVGFAGGRALARLQKAAGWDEWEQEHVYVIGHDNPGA
jgi:hypothetical protein